MPQKHANNRSLFWPRGKVLGGSSSLNRMIYMRGHASDYDGWAAQGCTGWGWDDVRPLFLRSEDHLTGANALHATGGPLPVSPITNPHPTAQAFVDTAVAAGHKRNEDFNGDDVRGVGFNEMTVRDGRRESGWQSFVAPVLDNSNLTVTTGALIDRVLLENGRAVGVEYVVDGARPEPAPWWSCPVARSVRPPSCCAAVSARRRTCATSASTWSPTCLAWGRTCTTTR